MQKLPQLSDKHQKWLVAVFFLLLYVIGMAVLPDYGIPSDEAREMMTLHYNEREYLRLFFDEEEIADYFEASLVEQDVFREYVDHDYGMAIYYPVAPLLAIGFISPHIRSIVWHCYIFLLFMLGCWALYSIIWNLFKNRGLACLAVLFLYLSPRIFAEGHYNNKDTVMMVMTLLMIWQGIHLMRKATVSRALVFAFIGALAMNQRIIGLFLFGLVALFVLIYHLLHRTMNAKTITAAVAVLAGFFGLYYLLTPNAWGQAWMGIPETFETFSDFSDPERWGGFVLFEGVTYKPVEEPLPSHYILWFMIITTPIYLLVLMLAGQISAAWAMVKRRAEKLADDKLFIMLLCTVMWFVPIVYTFVARPIAYDGWRHFEFIYAPLIILAIYGVYALWGLLQKRKWMRPAGAAALCLCVAWTGAGMIQNHPRQYAYFNVLAGDAETLYDGDYWFLGLKDALEELIAYPDLNPEMELAVSGFAQHRLYCLTYSDQQEITFIPYGDWWIADYVLVNPGRKGVTSSWTENYIDDEYLNENFKELFSIESYGHVIWRVYERLEILEEYPTEIYEYE